MIRKHVDLIAIALLLGGVAFCAHTRSVVMAGLRSSRGIWLTEHHAYSRGATTGLERIPFSRN